MMQVLNNFRKEGALIGNILLSSYHDLPWATRCIQKNELIKALNNFNYDRRNWPSIQITMYSGVTDIHYEIDKHGFANLYIDDQAGVTPLNDSQIKKLYNEAKVWYQQQLHLGKLAIQWDNIHHNNDKNPYGNRWDDELLQTKV